MATPLANVDLDGHAPCCVGDESFKAAQDGGENIAVGVGKSIANIGIGMNNVSAAFGISNYTEPYQPSNRTQAVAMVVTDGVTLFEATVIIETDEKNKKGKITVKACFGG